MAVSCGWGRDFLVLEKYWPLLVCKAALKLLYNHTSYSYFNNSVNVHLQATIMSSQYPQRTQLKNTFTETSKPLSWELNNALANYILSLFVVDKRLGKQPVTKKPETFAGLL